MTEKLTGEWAGFEEHLFIAEQQEGLTSELTGLIITIELEDPALQFQRAIWPWSKQHDRLEG